MDARDEDGEASPPPSPTFPPLMSASLFPPPPLIHLYYTPLNQWLYDILRQQKGDPTSDDGDETALKRFFMPSSMLRQRRILLKCAPEQLDSAPLIVRHSLLDKDEGSDESVAGQQQAQLRKHILQLPIDLLLEMDPPDLHVIREELKGYTVYDQWWPLPPVMTGIEEAGIKRLYDLPEQRTAALEAQQPVDRRPALLLLLRSWISTYLSLVSLLQFPPSYFALRTLHTTTGSFDIDHQPSGGASVDLAHDGDQPIESIEWLTTASSHWNHLRTIVINFQEVLNRCRRNQAANNVRAVLAQQLENRRRQTARIREKNKEIRQLLGSLQTQAEQPISSAMADISKAAANGIPGDNGAMGDTKEPIGRNDEQQEAVDEHRSGTNDRQKEADTLAARPTVKVDPEADYMQID